VTAAALLLAALPIAQPLAAEGARFSVELRGAVICCEEAKPNGWPLVTRKALRQMARAGANWTHVRLGPYPPSAEGEEFAAYAPGGSWNAAFWNRLRGLLAEATRLGVYVEIDVIDAWAFEHGRSAFGEDCSVLAGAPRPHHLKWIRKVAAETGGFPNVIYQVGNETFDCDTTPAWELGVRDALRAALGGPTRLIGTNSHDPELEAQFDYVARHVDEAQAPEGRPLIVNETGALTPAQFREQLPARPGQHVRALARNMTRQGARAADAERVAPCVRYCGAALVAPCSAFVRALGP
jgi:hypothetical protein